MAGESGGEFLATYQALIKEEHWKYYLTVKSKLLLKICGIINKELAYLAVLEETSLSSDLSLGYTLKALTGKEEGSEEGKGGKEGKGRKERKEG